MPIDGTEGVYSAQRLRKAIDEGYVRSRFRLPDSDVNQLQPASLDLRLGPVAHRLRCSFLPGAEPVTAKLERYGMGEVDLRDGAILERSRPYLIPLEEELCLPPTIRARANPKSSIGRLDVFTRVISDGGHGFDEVRAGYAGKLWLEVFSRTFTVRVQSGQSLNQVRLLEGPAAMSDQDVKARHDAEPIVFLDGSPLDDADLSMDRGLFLSLDLSGSDERFVGYRARRNSKLLDLTAPEQHDPDDFWEPVHSERGDRIILEPEEFYLLISREAVAVPPDMAAEMSAYDPTSGELRTHYAGFFDPGFGYDESGTLRGSRAVLEVRAHDVPFVVEHGQKICRLTFERMSERPEILYGRSIGSTYQGQVAMLSKYFLPRAEPKPA